MDKRAILLVASLFAATAVFAQAYRWVDEDGVVHFSDRPRPGAEQIQIPEANVTNLRRSPARAADEPEATTQQPFAYESLAISSPAAEETLWNIEGVLNVSLAVSPALQPGHQVRVYFDGQPRMVSGLSFQIDEVWRGVHNIQAEILDEGGKLMIRSETNRFYVQQNTVNF
ncbi:MAG: DUF4124 domain-containing protein [Woeseiaceae bacterium]|nr:DUF4124 domain-containing protein [Woeseiaceae bacterium]